MDPRTRKITKISAFSCKKAENADFYVLDLKWVGLSDFSLFWGPGTHQKAPHSIGSRRAGGHGGAKAYISPKWCKFH